MLSYLSTDGRVYGSHVTVILKSDYSMHYTKISSLYHLMGEGFEGGKRTGAEALCVRLRARLHHCVSVRLICLSVCLSIILSFLYLSIPDSAVNARAKPK